MANIEKVSIEHFFGDGKDSMLKREADLNNLLLQMSIILNVLVDRIDEYEKERR